MAAQEAYETQRRILAGLSVAQRRWERETGSRLVVMSTPPYFRYVTDPGDGLDRLRYTDDHQGDDQDEELEIYEHLPAWRIMPLIMHMHERFPRWRSQKAYEVQSSLWALRYVDALLPEEEIEAAMKVLRAIESLSQRAA